MFSSVSHKEFYRVQPIERDSSQLSASERSSRSASETKSNSYVISWLWMYACMYFHGFVLHFIFICPVITLIIISHWYICDCVYSFSSFSSSSSSFPLTKNLSFGLGAILNARACVCACVCMCVCVCVCECVFGWFLLPSCDCLPLCIFCYNSYPIFSVLSRSVDIRFDRLRFYLSLPLPLYSHNCLCSVDLICCAFCRCKLCFVVLFPILSSLCLDLFLRQLSNMFVFLTGGHNLQ